MYALLHIYLIIRSRPGEKERGRGEGESTGKRVRSRREHETARGREMERREGRLGADIDRVGDTYIFANTFSPVLQGWKVKRANDVALDTPSEFAEPQSI